MFRSVLERAQEKVERAYTATGKKSRAKGSPWMGSQERIRLRQESLESIQRLADNSSAAKLEMEKLQELLQQAELEHSEAAAGLQEIETAHSQQEAWAARVSTPCRGDRRTRSHSRSSQGSRNDPG